ncbi:heavy-metal-associated domain-containing protein [Actinoplanes sp. NPDC004185]
MCSENSCGCSTEAVTIQADQTSGVRTEYQVAGMTCGGCASRVSKQLTELPGVSAVSVDVAAGTVTVTSAAEVADEAVDSALTRAGYRLVR